MAVSASFLLGELGKRGQRSGQPRPCGQRLFKGAGNRQHLPVGARRSHNLQAKGHSLLVNATGKGAGRVRRKGDAVRERQPVEIAAQRFAVHFRQIQVRPREGGYRHHGCDQHVVLAEELLIAAIETGLLCMSPGEVGQRHRCALLVVGAHIRTQQRGVALVSILVLGEKAHRPDHLKAAVGLSRLGMSPSRLPEQSGEGCDFAFEGLPVRVIDRSKAEIGADGAAQRAEVYLRQGGKGRGVHRCGQWVHRVKPGLHREQQRHIIDGAAHRSGHRDRCPAQRTAVAGYQSRRRSEPHHTAIGGGNAQRTAGV